MAVSDTTVFCVNRGGCDRTHPWNDRQSIILVVPFWDNFWNLSARGLVPTHSVLSGGLSTSEVVFVSVPQLSGVRHASVEATTGYT